MLQSRDVYRAKITASQFNRLCAKCLSHEACLRIFVSRSTCQVVNDRCVVWNFPHFAAANDAASRTARCHISNISLGWQRGLATMSNAEHESVKVLKDLTAGTIGGCAGIVVGQPFDTIKVRLQASQRYSGPVDCLRRTVSSEGVGYLVSIYKPISCKLGACAV